MTLPFNSRFHHFFLNVHDSVPYLVVPDEMSEVSELILFLSWTMLKSANFEKSAALPLQTSRADLRDSSNRISSSFRFTSGPPS